MAQAGGPDYVMDFWFGVAVPAGTPPQVAASLNREINRIIAQPEVKSRLEDMGVDLIGGSAESFGKTIAADVAKWSRVVREANLKPE
jgi:tripartite-type tricarboxylate transporter receptor subunit TctC